MQEATRPSRRRTPRETYQPPEVELDGEQVWRPDLREWIPWVGIFLLGAFLRLLLIDLRPLSPTEAAIAFPAWQTTQQQMDSSMAELGSPILTHGMTLLFWLFGAGDITARLIPVLVGSIMIVVPAALIGMISRRAALAAAALIAISPIAVELSRIASQSVIAATATLLVTVSALRVLTDRPVWSPWLLGASVGLALVSGPGTVIALVMAGIAGTATWSPSRRDITGRLRELGSPGARWPIFLGAIIALVVGTGLLTDLRGIGFMVGDLWGGALTAMVPAPFPSRNLAALLVYAGPLLVLAAWEFVWGVRHGERLAQFLGQWLLLLLAVAIALGQGVVSFAILPVAPAAILTAMLIDRRDWSTLNWRFSGSAVGAMVMTVATLFVTIMVVSNITGTVAKVSVVGYVAPVAFAAITWMLWRRVVDPEERRAAWMTLTAVTLALFFVSGIGHASFGGSPPGSEILTRVETAPALRDRFNELAILASADPRIVLVADASTPVEVRWYGRALAQVPESASLPQGAVRIREVAPNATPGAPFRTPWKTISELNRAELTPMGMLQWVVSRHGLIVGQDRDIIVAR